LTDASSNSAAAAGSVASSFSAGSQEAAKTLKLKLFEADFGEIVIRSFDEVINASDTFGNEDLPILIEIRFSQKVKGPALRRDARVGINPEGEMRLGATDAAKGTVLSARSPLEGDGS
jgi:hypothetical protein